jgi:hypothetical protein
MNTILQEQIIKQIKKADDVILLEIQELLNVQNTDLNQKEVPLYVKQRLEKSKDQAQKGIYISHKDVMKRYK